MDIGWFGVLMVWKDYLWQMFWPPILVPIYVLRSATISITIIWERPRNCPTKNGEVVWAAVYDAFGKARMVSDSKIENDLRFPGQYFDAESGVLYNYHRYYYPSTVRYLSIDPIGQTISKNPYHYAYNNPIKMIDPLGLRSGSILGNAYFEYEMDKLFADSKTGIDQYLLDLKEEIDQLIGNTKHDICLGNCFLVRFSGHYRCRLNWDLKNHEIRDTLMSPTGKKPVGAPGTMTEQYYINDLLLERCIKIADESYRKCIKICGCENNMSKKDAIVCISFGITYWAISNGIYSILKSYNNPFLKGLLIFCIIPLIIGYVAQKFLVASKLKHIIVYSLFIFTIREVSSVLVLIIMFSNDSNLLNYLNRSIIGFLRLGPIQLFFLCSGAWLSNKIGGGDKGIEY